MTAQAAVGVATLRDDDLIRFSYWLWITRLRSIAGLLGLAIVLSLVVPSAVPLGPITLVALADLATSPLYNWWMRARRFLRLLVYVQLAVDTFAILAGLFFVQQSPVLFHFLLLLPIVPACMMEWQYGVVIATLASIGHFLLLWVNGTAALVSVAGLLPPACFFLIASQSLFYARHLAQKNSELALAAESLNQINVSLEEEHAISAALLRAAQALTASLDPGEILGRLNDVVRSALPCDWSVTLLRDAQRNIYRVAAVSGTEPDALEEVRNFEFPSDSVALINAVVQQGLVMVENRDSPLFPGAIMDRWHMRSFLCADLRHAGSSIGILAAGFNERTGPCSAREVRVFQSIAQQAVVALENARLVESLRAASRLKSEFIGTMSHELRSPLNVVIGYVDLLIDEDMGAISDEQRHALERVRQHALQLLELIREALDINRLEAGLLPLDIETFAVHEFLDEVKDSIPADWTKPNVDLTWQIDHLPILIRSDRAKLKKVLRNLVHNALKFTDHGQVTMKVSALDGWVDFTVSDTGIGMDAEALPFIFDMFRQVDGSTTRRHGGVGLGLYIVKQLVRALGGDINVSSTPGSGSIFRVRLRRSE
ncbi:MAG: ATP-binding protein [Candidatus Binatia bacterium]